MKFREYLKEGAWFNIGRELSFLYVDKTGNSSLLKPNKKLLKNAAKEIGISVSDAEIALGVYNSGDPIEDEKSITKSAPKMKRK